MNDARETLRIAPIHETYVNTETIEKSYGDADEGCVFVTKPSERRFPFSAVSLNNTIPSILDGRVPS